MPKRILMTADTIGGVWNYALELTLALAELGVEVVLATMGATLTRQQRQAASKIPNLQVEESDFKLEWMDNPWEDVTKAGEWLLQLEERTAPDIVHLNGYVHAALTWRTPVIVVGHSCVLSWWEAVKGETAPAEWEKYRQEVTRGLRAADMVIAPSAAMLAAIDRFYGCLSKSLVIPNGRNPTLFYPTTKKEIILSVGRLWDEAKNVAALAEIAPKLSWDVYVAGESKHPQGGSTVYSNIHLLGQLDAKELASWYGRAGIYVLPARYEPFGLSVLEAALSGCALVLGDIASLREIWGDTAVYVSPDDKEAIGHTINNIIQDEAKRINLATKARIRALEFTPELMAKGYMVAYTQVISGN